MATCAFLTEKKDKFINHSVPSLPQCQKNRNHNLPVIMVHQIPDISCQLNQVADNIISTCSNCGPTWRLKPDSMFEELFAHNMNWDLPQFHLRCRNSTHTSFTLSQIRYFIFGLYELITLQFIVLQSKSIAFFFSFFFKNITAV